MKINRFFIKGITLLIWLTFGFVLSQNCLAGLNFKISTIDTIAGYSALLKTSQIEADTDIDFLITKPNSSEIKLQTKTNPAGLGEVEVFGYNTKQAGLYTVLAKRKTETEYTNQTTFRVYPDTLSSSQSMLRSDKTTAAGNGSDEIYVKVTLADRYRNPISNHQVKLISSRPEDEITRTSQSTSDENGNVVFEVKSRYPGISVYTAFDVNTGITLDDRVKVVFYTPLESEKPRGGSILQADLLTADTMDNDAESSPAGPAQSFDIIIPDEVPLNTAQTIQVIARDKNKNVAKDYSGTVLFATPDDENATLPSEDGEFTFSDKDLGEFTFNLAITFTKPGIQKIEVFDKEDWDLKGETKVNVVEDNGNNGTPAATGILEIKTPADGSELSTATTNLLGKGATNDQIKIFDNDVKIGETEVDGDGMFTFTATNLSDGLHAIYAKGSEDVSNTINITIDSTPPMVDSFEIKPDGELETGATYSVKVMSEPNLRKSQIRINGVPEQLVESSQNKGTYETTLIAPDVGGDYPIDILLTDTLGNKGEYLNKGILKVKKIEIPKPPKVTGLRAKADEWKVDLNWDIVTDHTSAIVKYRIHYGELESSLNKTVETNGAVNKWYVPNLTNGQKYYFAVTAVDNQSYESAEKSLIVSALPKKKESLVRAVASDSKVTLSWNVFGQNPARYKIKYGVEPGNYSESILISDNRTTWYIPDLINNVSYSFQVIAIDHMGNEQAYAPEVSATPFGSGYKPVAGTQNHIYVPVEKPKETTGSGPEVWIVVLFSLLFIDIILRLKRKRY